MTKIEGATADIYSNLPGDISTSSGDPSRHAPATTNYESLEDVSRQLRPDSYQELQPTPPNDYLTLIASTC